MAAKTNRIKAPALETEAEFREEIAEIARLQNKVLALCARRDGAVQRLQETYALHIDPLDAEIDAKLALVEKYADAHRASLLPKDKKSVELATAVVGWRTGNRTVRPVGKRITEEEIIETLKACGLGAYVRTKDEIAKDRILADAKFDDVLNDDVLTASDGALHTLADVSLKITQSEAFYVEPKAPTGETLKPAD
jgi:phage host-nuclease inhibitor protein Gam